MKDLLLGIPARFGDGQIGGGNPEFERRVTQQRIILVDMAPARLHHRHFRVGEERHRAAQEVRRRDEVGVEDRDVLPPGDLQARLERPGPYRSPWGTLFSFGEDPPDDAGYFLSEDKSLLFILVETPPSEKGSFTGDQAAIETIRGAIDGLRPSFPNVQAGVTGPPALSNDEMATAFHDSGISDVLAFARELLAFLERHGHRPIAAIPKLR